MTLKKILKRVRKFIYKNKLVLLIFLLLFSIHLFLRFSELESRAQFTWDQVDNAWHAKNMIVNGEFPLTGMPAKGNSSVTIGPFYYYFVAFFYLLTNLDPIASPIIAGFVSVFSFFILFWAGKKLFNTQIALIAVFINTFSNYLIGMDRIQWPVTLIAPTALIIFLSLKMIIDGRLKYIFLLAITLGFSLHVHFTSIFYIIIVLLALPLFPRKKKTILYMLYSIPLFLIWTITFFLSLTNEGSSLNIASYIKENNVGFHIRRVIQVAEIAFVEFQLIFYEKIPGFVKFLPIPLFMAIYYFKEHAKNKLSILYLTFLWFVIPWFVLSTFAGELTQYYFSMTRYVMLIAVSYLIYSAFIYKLKIFVPVFAVVGILFISINMFSYSKHQPEMLDHWKKVAYQDFKESRGNEFVYGSSKSYLYYFYEYRAYGKK